LCRGAGSSEPFQAQAGGADAAARALPVQERHSPRGDVVSHRARALVAQPRAQPVPAHRAAAAPAGRRRLARDAGGDRMKVALITGGSSGMGEASARELAKRGWQVAIMFSKNKAQADRVAGDINSLALQGDVAAVVVLRHVALKGEAVDVAGDAIGLRLVLREHDRDLPAALRQLARARLARSEEHTSELQSPDHLV